MRQDTSHRPIAAAVIMAYLGTAIFPAGAQTPECTYDRHAPSLANARVSFQEFDFVCAEREIADLLQEAALDAGVQADAHALLAAIYFQTLQDVQRRREKVIEAFRRTFSLRPDWHGQLEIPTSAFRDLMAEAKRQVETLRAKEQPASPPAPAGDKTKARGQENQARNGGKSKKKWVYVALGAAVVGVAAFALGGGGGSKGDGGLPDFPPPPSGSNR